MKICFMTWVFLGAVMGLLYLGRLSAPQTAPQKRFTVVLDQAFPTKCALKNCADIYIEWSRVYELVVEEHLATGPIKGPDGTAYRMRIE